MMKKIVSMLLIMMFLTGCSWFQQDPTSKIVYKNSELNFSVELPASAKGYDVSVDNDPIPPDVTTSVSFFMKGDGFLNISIFDLETWESFSDTQFHEIGRTDDLVFTAVRTTGGRVEGYRLSDDEFKDVQESFELLD